MARGRLGLGLLGMCWLSACDGEPAYVASRVRPGDSLLRLLEDATLVEYPETNLARDVLARVRAPFRTRTEAIEASQWVPAGNPPADLREALAEHPRVRFWRTKPALHRHSGPVTLLVGGEVHSAWDPAERPFPGQAVFWDEASESVHALSVREPEAVVLEYLGDPEGEFGDLERRLFSAERPAVPSLVQRRALGEVSRPSLLAPAPARIDFRIDALAADELHVALAVAPGSYRVVQDRVEASAARTDGVVFVVEVEAAGERRELLRRTLGAEAVGREFVRDHADLSPYRGRPITLTLRTEPGADGNSDFDYALWSDLTLRGSKTRPPEQPHVILISLDTLRADRLGCYGSPRDTSPRIDAWARKNAVVYKDAMATAGWTLPSTASIMTGLSVHQHGVEKYPEALSAATPTLAALLHAQGYETRSWNEGIYVKADFGFDLGFDCYDSRHGKHPDWDEPLRWIRSRQSERPLFLFLHTYLVHAPYPASARFEEDRPAYAGPLAGKTVGYRDVIHPVRRGELTLDTDSIEYISRLYDARVAELDAVAGAFLEALDDALDGEDYLLVMTSDHGDEFMEHGSLDHGHSLYQELLHVPLLIRMPGGLPVGVNTDPVSTLDIVPTILDALDLPRGSFLPGRSLLDPAPAETPRVAQFHTGNHALRMGPYKLLRGGALGSEGVPVQLYDLSKDPTEQHNLIHELPAKAAELERLLDAYLQRYPATPLPSPGEAYLSGGELDSLRALGYLDDEPVPPSSGTEHPEGNPR